MNAIDERGRLAADRLRGAMTDGFDVDAGLAAVRSGLDENRARSALHAEAPQVARRTWMLAAAALVAVGLAGVALLVTRDSTTSGVSDRPTDMGGPSPATTVEAVPEGTTSPAPSTTVDAGAATDSTSSTEPVLEPRTTVNVIEVAQAVAPVRSVVATAGYGSGAGELTIEDCQECDPARPWAPVRLPDGRVVVADPANGRWVVFESVPSTVPGEPSTTRTTDVPWPDRVTASSQPVVDEAGTVYVTMYGPLGAGGTTAGQLWVFDSADLAEPVATYPASGVFGAPPQLLPGAVVLDGAPVDGLSATLRPRPIVRVMLDRNGVQLVDDDVTTTFVYPAGQSIVPFGPLPGLPDSTALIHVFETGREFVDRLYPDGRVARMEVPSAGSVFGAAWVDDAGFLQLEVAVDRSSWDLVQYDLPRAFAYTAAVPVSGRAAAIFANATPEPFVDGVVGLIGSALGAEFRDDCVDPAVSDPQASYEQDGTGRAVATFELRIGCDDSGGGFRWVADLEFDGEAWRVVAVTEQTICVRGVTELDGRELCV